jgi:glutamate dehydrogenase
MVMKKETEAVAELARGLGWLRKNRRRILAHLPKMLRTEERYRCRLKLLPEKYLFAILASETASSMVYRENREADFLGVLQGHLQRSFGEHIERKIA